MWKYLPRDTDQGAYFKVFTREPVVINEGAKHCPHPQSTYCNFSDLRSDNLDRYDGKCCTACGRFTEGPHKVV